MKNDIPFSGAYWRRYSNYTEQPNYTLEVLSGDPTMGTAGYIKLATISTAEEAAQQVVNRGGATSYPAGSKFRVTATPFEGYRFVQWQTNIPNIDGNGHKNTNQNPVVITLDRNTWLQARFERVQGGNSSGNGGGNGGGQQTHTVTVNFDPEKGRVEGNGLNLTSNRGQAQLTAHAGDTVKLTATPGSGYHFVKWTGGPSNGTENKPEYTFQVNNNYNITAVFEADGNGGGNGGNGGSNGGSNSGTGNGGNMHTSLSSGGLDEKVTRFVKKWWWALLIAAYLIYKERKGGSK